MAAQMAVIALEPSRPYPPTTPPEHSFKTPKNASAVLAASFDAASDRPEETILDNRGATFPPDPKSEAQEVWKPKNAPRWRLKAQVVGLLRPEDGSRGPAVCGCGRPGHEVEEVTLHRRESGAAGVGGVYRCDSPWLCPTCAPARAQRRKERLQEVIVATEALGGDCAFVTLTLQHDLSLRLVDAKRVLSAASRAARQGREWIRIKTAGGIIGIVQGVEALHSTRTGWHFHAHLIVSSSKTGDELLAAVEEFVDRYLAEVRKRGLQAKKQGQDVQIVWDGQASDYASKGSAAWEVAGGLKDARSAVSRTPWQLAQLADAGDEAAKILFLEYAETMPGTRSCVVSASLADALDLAADDDDDAPGEDQDLSEFGEVLGTVPSSTWGRIISRRKAHQVFAAIEDGDTWVTINDLVQRLGQPPPTPPPPERSIDVDRFAADALRWRSVGRSPAVCRGQMRSDIEAQKRSYERAGYVVRVDHDQADRAFLKMALEMG